MNEGLTHDNYTISDIHKEYAVNGKIQRLANPLNTKWAKNLNGIAAYLTKYISKNKDEFNCSVWHCSRDVSKLCTSSATTKEVFEEIGDKTKNNFTSKKTGKYYEVKDYKTEWALVRSILNKSYYDKFMIDLHLVNTWILNGRKEKDIPNVKNKEFVLFHLSQN
ncbi:MAG: hypothetical protein DI598_14980 [Pseudopedobacter saltans]|uniref:Uncharacterized protein n=1 Tax=Pseudopedobacter saltans TaxID=151895 RepID=A0A2W5ER50_9SPHI|nr:MAG: hypothetical protein DI598_14980 [Pseudopedobacter saltans]